MTTTALPMAMRSGRRSCRSSMLLLLLLSAAMPSLGAFNPTSSITSAKTAKGRRNKAFHLKNEEYKDAHTAPASRDHSEDSHPEAADSGMYEGECKDGKMHGRGKMRYANGCVYEGGWKDGTMHGQGAIKWVNGDVYEGDWKDGTMHGRGTYSEYQVATQVYEGEWKDGKKDGRGAIKLADGTVFEGRWKDDRRIVTATHFFWGFFW